MQHWLKSTVEIKLWGHRSSHCAHVEIQARAVGHSFGAANGAKNGVIAQFAKVPSGLDW